MTPKPIKSLSMKNFPTEQSFTNKKDRERKQFDLSDIKNKQISTEVAELMGDQEIIPN